MNMTDNELLLEIAKAQIQLEVHLNHIKWACWIVIFILIGFHKNYF